MPSAQPSTTPWAHTDFERTDPTIKSLAQHVITASGGGIRIKHQDVRTHLTAWFNATIPDIFGASPFDYAAVDSQAYYLCSCEGSSNAVEAWGSAVVEEFRSHPQWPTCFEENLAFAHLFRYTASSIAVRGMQLYSAAFCREAAARNITQIPVHRALSTRSDRWLPNALASMSWSPNHVDDGRHVIRTTMVDPSVIVGITLVRECHPVIAPFSITAGPGVASVVFD